ncbi:CDP-alcohol phosphatidyltransferase family protein [Candidatus Micrarchaeota archaeon]|nr:CDP-alcohol phosphatidyltransferase family protein [Candidatus Micrarchaeota archaeon]
MEKFGKKTLFNPPNTITFFRVILAIIIFILLVYSNSKNSSLAYIIILLILLIYFLDWLDGYVARKTKTSTDLGSMIDIAGDRTIEIMLLIAFAYLGLISKIIPIIFLVRGQITDTLRYYLLKDKKLPYKGLHKKGSLAQFLTASRFMRGLSGLSKLSTFLFASFVFLLQINEWYYIVNILAWFAALINIIRGIYPTIDGIKQSEKVIEYV